MGRSNRVRATLALGLATLLLPIAAAPAGAAIIVEGCHLNCGDWSVTDASGSGNQGATCRYEKPGFDLDAIAIRPPTMEGFYSSKTKVAWRFKIYRAPVNTGTFSKIYTSSWQYSMASTTDSAGPGDGFSRRTWTAPENPHGFFDVWIELRWWKNGQVDGQALANYEWFKAKRGSSSHPSQGYCLEDF